MTTYHGGGHQNLDHLIVKGPLEGMFERVNNTPGLRIFIAFRFKDCLQKGGLVYDGTPALC